MRTVLLLSGGLDSVTMLAHLKDKGHLVHCLSFDYGQTHYRELQAATYFADKYGNTSEIVRLRGVFAGSALTNDLPMPEGRYTDESMKQTVVPNRNMVMLSIAAAKAIDYRIGAVAYAAHADDFGTYPDCRPDFVHAMRNALSFCSFGGVRLLAPFLHMSKRDIAKRAKELEVPIDKTWSCYAGGEQPCGKCGACSARSEALA